MQLTHRDESRRRFRTLTGEEEAFDFMSVKLREVHGDWPIVDMNTPPSGRDGINGAAPFRWTGWSVTVPQVDVDTVEIDVGVTSTE